MSRPLQLSEWQSHLSSRFPALPLSYVVVLALYSFATIAVRSCGLSAVACFLAKTLLCSFPAIRKRLIEFYKDAPSKSRSHPGGKRLDFDVSDCFNPLLRWILSLWPNQHLPLALDVTNLGSRFHVLAISVVVSGVAIPVAWKVLRGESKGAWNPHWRSLLKHLKRSLRGDTSATWPDGLMVLVLCDRGLESVELFKAIAAQGWHPFLRVKKGGKFRPKGWSKFYLLSELVPEVGRTLAQSGNVYQGRQLEGTLLAMWEEGYDEPWFVITDLPPETANVLWYGLRTWIEQGFKVIKSGGWNWDKTRMEEASRVERLWLVMAVSCLWIVVVGDQDETREKVNKEMSELEKEMREGQERARERKLAEEERKAKRLAASKKAIEMRQAKKREEAAAKEAAAKEAAGKETAAKEKATKEGVAKEKAETAAPPKEAAQTKTAEAKKPKKKKEGKKKSQGKRQEWKKEREQSVFRRGWMVLKALWLKGENELPKQLNPEPWPAPSLPLPILSEADFLARRSLASFPPSQ